MIKRKRCSAKFKAKVAREVIREDLTTPGLARRYSIPPTMISGRKKTAVANMASAFGGGSSAEPPVSAGDMEKLRPTIGQLVVERDFSADASSLILEAGRKKR